MEAHRFVLAAKVFEAHAPDVGVDRIDVDTISGIVTVWSPYPSLLIGRRGETADSIRLALSEALGIQSVKLHIVESRGDGPDAPPEGGVREPRRPKPSIR
jgi:ribosomal protein S3